MAPGTTAIWDCQGGLPINWCGGASGVNGAAHTGFPVQSQMAFVYGNATRRFASLGCFARSNNLRGTGRNSEEFTGVTVFVSPDMRPMGHEDPIYLMI